MKKIKNELMEQGARVDRNTALRLFAEGYKFTSTTPETSDPTDSTFLIEPTVKAGDLIVADGEIHPVLSLAHREFLRGKTAPTEQEVSEAPLTSKFRREELVLRDIPANQVDAIYRGNDKVYPRTSHVHAEEILAWLDGQQIQEQQEDGRWHTYGAPAFDVDREYRVYEPFKMNHHVIFRGKGYIVTTVADLIARFHVKTTLPNDTRVGLAVSASGITWVNLTNPKATPEKV